MNAKDNTIGLGSIITVYGVACRIYRVHKFGTFDVEATDGSGRCWRVSGYMAH